MLCMYCALEEEGLYESICSVNSAKTVPIRLLVAVETDESSGLLRGAAPAGTSKENSVRTVMNVEEPHKSIDCKSIVSG